MFMITSKEYPECPEYDGITYPTFDHQTGKTRARRNPKVSTVNRASKEFKANKEFLGKQVQWDQCARGDLREVFRLLDSGIYMGLGVGLVFSGIHEALKAARS